MRLSRPRVLLRAVLLTVGGGFMLWKALDAWRAAAGAPGSDGVLLQRIAVVEALVGALALAAAAIALLSLRTRRRRHTLVLRDVPAERPEADAGARAGPEAGRPAEDQ